MPDPAATKRSPEHWFALVCALAAPLGLAALAFVLQPDPRGFGTHEQLGFQPCLPIRLWNVPCPGCGVTTAVTLALQGHPLRSVVTQPFGLVTIAVVFAFACFALRAHRRGLDLFRELERLPWLRLGAPLVVLFGASWIYKLARVRGWI